MKNNIKQLGLYSLSGAAFLSLHEKADAQIIYHDLDPDSFIGHSSLPEDIEDTLVVDFNNDGNADIRFIAHRHLSAVSSTFTSATVLITSHNTLYIDSFDAVVNDPSYPLSFGAMILSDGDIVGPDTSWNTTDEIKLLHQNHIESSDILSTNYPFQNWNKENNILGVRFMIGSETHYGWIRLGIKKIGWPSKLSFPELVIQDYAYEATADTPIMIENPAVDFATNVMLADITETNTIHDLQISFNKAADETAITAYHVFITPSAEDADAFLLSKEFLETLPADRYYSIIPTGDDISFLLDDTVKDVFGNTVTIDTYYNVFVLSVADTDIITKNSLALPAPREQATLRRVSSPQNVYMEYAETNLDMSDFTVHFTGGGYWGHQGQEGISEYRVFMIATTYYVPNFFDTLAVQSEENYISILPDTTGIYSVTFTPDKEIFDDVNDSLFLFHTYSCAVLAVADGIKHSLFGAATPGPEDDGDVFYYPHYNVTPVINIIGSTGTLSDAEVYFPKFYNEDNLDEYRFMIVKESDTASFDALAAHYVPSDNYKRAIPDGEDVIMHLSSLTDIYGNDVDPAEQYYVYVCLKGAIGSIKDISVSNPALLPALSTGFSAIENIASVIVDNNIIQIHCSEKFTTEFYSISGQLIYQYVNCMNSFSVNCTGLTAGQYILKIKTQKGTLTERIILK